MSDVRCPSCGDSFRVPDFAVPAGAMAKCPWCSDTFSMSMLVVHLPPLAELIGDDGEPISMADLARTAAPMALASVGAANGSTFGAVEFGDQRLGNSELANDVGEFAEEGVTFADAGVPERTDETTEWNLDSTRQTDGDDDELFDNQSDDSSGEAYQNAETENDFSIEGGSPPRPLAEVTDFGVGREDRPFVSRPRTKRQGSPIKSILGIVIGGLMAFPLAAGILALAGKPLDLGFWPFDGQTISMNAESRRGAAPPVDVSPRVANNGNKGNRAGRSLADDMASLDVDPPSLAGSPGDTDRGALDQSVLNDLDNLLTVPTPSSEFAEIKPPSSINLPPLSLPTTLPAAVAAEMEAEVSETDPAGLAVEPVPAETPASIAPTADAPQSAEVSSALQSVLDEASVAMGEVVNYDDSEGVKGKRSRLAALFSKVAAVASTASSEDEAAVGSLVDRLVDSDLVKDLAPAAPNWAKFAGRPNKGMLATGKLVREDDQWLLQWSGPVPLNVRFTDPSIAEEGANVIILGTIEQTDPTTVVEVSYLQKQ